MRSILREKDFASALAERHSVIFFFVDWSVYAVQGRRMFKELESICGPDLKGSFWLADVSDTESPAAFLGGWLKEKERPDLKIFNVAGCGNGSVVWLRNGAIVDFAQSATHHKVQDLRTRTEKAFQPRAVKNNH